MRRRISAVGFAAAALTLISSLGSTAFAAGAGGTLEGPLWVLQRYADGGALVDVPAAVDATATFDAGRVAGRGGCNGFGGDYTLAGASITFGPLVSTMMACGSPQDDVERAYFADLGKAATWSATADSLTMYDASGAEILVFAASEPAPLQGTLWQLTSYNNGRQAVVSVLADTSPTAVFGPDGSVSVNATCNSFRGPFTATAGTIGIGPLATTRMACPTPDQQDQEAAYLSALQASTAYAISGSTLEFRDASGALQASFTAAADVPMPVDIGGGTGATDTSVPETSMAPGTDVGGMPPSTLALLAVAFIATMVILPLRAARNR